MWRGAFLCGIGENMSDVQKTNKKKREYPESTDAEKKEALYWVNMALVRLSGQLPYFGPLICRIKPVPQDNIGTAAISDRLIMYFAPKFVLQLMIDAEAVSQSDRCGTCGRSKHSKLAYLCGMIMHEAFHPLKRHSLRFDHLSGLALSGSLWNVAADLEINAELEEIYNTPSLIHIQVEAVKDPCLRLCEYLFDDEDKQKILSEHGPDYDYLRPMVPEMYKLPNGKLAENYYYALLNRQQEGDGGGGGNSDMIPTMMGGCGSATGVPAENEVDVPDSGVSDDDSDGVSEQELESIRRQVAANVSSQARAIGNMPAGLEMWADAVLGRSPINWKSIIRQRVRRAVHMARGLEVRTFRRLGRRTGFTFNRYGYVVPHHFTPVPELAVGIDTSGSMYGLGSETLSTVNGVLASMNTNVLVVTGDVEPQVCRASKLNEITFEGGGGTDMREVIAACDRPGVDLAILITDGWTPWPSHPPKHCKLLICIVGAEDKEYARREMEIPGWVRENDLLMVPDIKETESVGYGY